MASDNVQTLEALTGLLRIITDPKSVADEVQRLATATAGLHAAQQEADAQRAEIVAMTQHVGDMKRQLEVSQGDAAKAAQEAQDQRTALAQEASAYAITRQKAEDDLAAASAALRNERDAFASQCTQQSQALSAREAQIAKLENEHEAKAKVLAEREVAVVAREAAAQAIIDEASKLAQMAGSKAP